MADTTEDDDEERSVTVKVGRPLSARYGRVIHHRALRSYGGRLLGFVSAHCSRPAVGTSPHPSIGPPHLLRRL